MYNVLIAASFVTFIASSLTSNPMFALIGMLLGAVGLGFAIRDLKPKQ